MGLSIVMLLVIAVGVFFLIALGIALVVALKGKNRDGDE